MNCTSKAEEELDVIGEHKLNESAVWCYCKKKKKKKKKKANVILEDINRGFICKTQEVIILLYLLLVKPQMEYYVPFWKLYCKKNIEKLEKIQWRMTRIVRGLENTTCYERL